jgi:hypothetical protein
LTAVIVTTLTRYRVSRPIRTVGVTDVLTPLEQPPVATLDHGSSALPAPEPAGIGIVLSRYRDVDVEPLRLVRGRAPPFLASSLARRAPGSSHRERTRAWLPRGASVCFTVGTEVCPPIDLTQRGGEDMLRIMFVMFTLVSLMWMSAAAMAQQASMMSD